MYLHQDQLQKNNGAIMAVQFIYFLQLAIVTDFGLNIIPYVVSKVLNTVIVLYNITSIMGHPTNNIIAYRFNQYYN